MELVDRRAGPSDDFGVAEDCAGGVDWQVGLTQMHAVGVGGVGDVCPVVDDDSHSKIVGDLDHLCRVVEEFVGGHVFFADLDAPGPGSGGVFDHALRGMVEAERCGEQHADRPVGVWFGKGEDEVALDVVEGVADGFEGGALLTEAEDFGGFFEDSEGFLGSFGGGGGEIGQALGSVVFVWGGDLGADIGGGVSGVEEC